MKASFKLFQKAFVWDYYRQNALFILVILLFCFGFLSGAEHKTIILNGLKSPLFFFYIFIFWTLYAIKTYLFVLRSLNDKRFGIIYLAKNFSLKKRIILWLGVQSNILLLTLLYAFAMVIIGLGKGYWMESLKIIMANVVLIALGIVLFERRIAKPAEAKKWKFYEIWNLKFNTHPILYIHRYLIKNQPVLFLITKVSSLVILQLFLWLYPTDAYDPRLFSIAALLIAVSHYAFGLHWGLFEREYFQFYRNLPFSVLKRFLRICLEYSIFLIPEALLFLKNSPVDVSYYYKIAWLVFLLALAVLLHQLTYLSKWSEEKKMQTVFFGSITLMLLIMFKIALIVFAVFGLMLAFISFRKNYPIYE